MAIGDILFGLMGQPNPQQQLTRALGQGPGNSPMGQAIASGSSAAPPPTSGSAPSGQNQQQQQQPTPQAYQTPPDMGQMYLNLMQRQQANANINTGLGLLAGAFSHNQADRNNMISAMQGLNASQPNAGEQMSAFASLQQSMFQRQALLQQLQNAPMYAKQLGIPVEQVTAFIQAGKLPDIMDAVAKQKMLQNSPLYGAQVASTQAEAGKATAETGAIPSTVAKTQAETAAIPFTVAKTQADTALAGAQAAALPATTAKIQAETAAIPAQIAKTQADTAVAQAQAQKAAADAQARANLATLTQDPNFTTKYGITPAAAQALPPDELAKFIASVPQRMATTTAKISAEDMATARAGLPAADLKAREAMDLADNIVQDPSLQYRTGLASYAPALWGNEAGTQAKIDKLQGTSGVAAVDALKGGIGRIHGSEFSESEKAQSLLGAQHVSTGTYQGYVNDFKTKLGTQMAQMYQKAGLPVPDYYKPYVAGTSPPSAAPPVNSAISPPLSAIDHLRKNPNLAPQFDAMFGKGASLQYLGQ